MRGYMVFQFDQYYPAGGWRDYKGTFYTLQNAKSYINKNHYDYFQIVDISTMKVIEQNF